MRSVLKIFALSVAVCLFASVASSAFAAEKDPKTGATVESGKVIAVPGITSNQLLKLISDAKDQVVVVSIFASWCPPCREEAPSLIELRNKYSDKEVLFVGVSVDETLKALYTFMDDIKFNFPIYTGEDNFEQQVGVTAIPQLLIYSKKGELALNHKGLVEQSALVTFIDKQLKN